LTGSELAKKLRLPLGFLLAALYVIFAPLAPTFTWQSLLIGGIIALIGVLIRGWASGHIMKNDRLATTGPYAHTRNPLYFGSFLISVGFAVAAHWALVFVVAIFFLVIYAPTMAREKANIKGRFPHDYPKYQNNVPAFFPRVVPWRGSGMPAESVGFSMALYMKHGEWKAALGYAGAMVYLGVRLWMKARHAV
jgi:protein-S-isoprenylcysteine O-methyltransferase Ste14